MGLWSHVTSAGISMQGPRTRDKIASRGNIWQVALVCSDSCLIRFPQVWEPFHAHIGYCRCKERTHPQHCWACSLHKSVLMCASEARWTQSRPLCLLSLAAVGVTSDRESGLITSLWQQQPRVRARTWRMAILSLEQVERPCQGGQERFGVSAWRER